MEDQGEEPNTKEKETMARTSRMKSLLGMVIGKGRLIDGISMAGKTLGTMARTTWMRNLVDTWTLVGQTYRWDK